jgi:hypothetical protein
MRLWSIHPKYLDVSGLLGLWRESLLAKKVLEGKTKGYKNHPQLDRFKNSFNYNLSINFYLKIIYQEANSRGYNFDIKKINMSLNFSNIKNIPVTTGQLLFEKDHLMNKLRDRNIMYYNIFNNINIPITHPVFHVIKGGIEYWEKL